MCIRDSYKTVSVKNKKTILCTNHLGWQENSLATNDWDPVELSRESCHQFPQPNLWPPQNFCLFWVSHLVGKSSFLCYRWNVQDKWAFCGFGRFGLCVFIFSARCAMTCHGTKDNTGLTDFIPVSFLFYTSCFTGKTILRYALASQTRE